MSMLLSGLKLLLPSIFGGKSLIESLSETYIKYKDSENEELRVKADLAKAQLDSLTRARELQTQIRVATAGFWEMRLLTFLIAFPFVVHLWFVTIDTVFLIEGWSVAAFPAPFNEWEGHILLSFFGIFITTKLTTTAAGIVGMFKR